MLLRILGTVDNFKDTFEINLESFEIIKVWKQEIIFHKSLQMNQKTLKNSKISEVIDSINNFDNQNNNLIETNNNKSNFHLRKNFANKVLAFFKKYKFSDEINQEKNYIILKINSLLTNPHFSTMINDFCRDNNITDQNKFLIESLTIIEENSMGKLIDDDQSIEIKLDDEINDEILRMLRSNANGLSYIDIFDKISKM